MSETPAQAFAALRGAQARLGPLGLEERRSLLLRMKKLLVAEREALAAALDADYGGRNAIETLLAEVYVVVRALGLSRRRLRRWARPRRLGVTLPFWPARAQSVPRPKGAVGVLAPWNYPIQLSLWPLADALAAGNRVAVKLPEATPRCSALLVGLLDRLDPDAVRAVEGGPEIAAAFAALPWDHLFFTGSARVGRAVLRAAAENLTPTTLELGGKCPAVVTEGADLRAAAEAILKGKALNGGQTCLAPDTVLLVGVATEDFVAACRTAALRLRLEEEATRPQRARPCRATAIAAGPIALHCDLPPEAPLLHEEVFGMELPVVALADLEQAIAWIAERAAPLAIYVFTRSEAVWRRLQDRTRSGALVRNATVVQAAIETLPFGGVGGSGFGRYRGEAGFETFSDWRTELRLPRRYLGRLLERPYGAGSRRLLERLLRFG